MEGQFKTMGGRLLIKFDAASQKELFEHVASLAEVFEADNACGMCNKSNLRYRVRRVSKGNKAFTYYELSCTDCWARLAFGQSTDTVSLFPKRKAEDGEWLPNRGWSKYQPKDEEFTG